MSELKRIIELQPLEMPAAAAVASRLAMLTPPQFSALLSELARDNHAFRWALLPNTWMGFAKCQCRLLDALAFVHACCVAKRLHASHLSVHPIPTSLQKQLEAGMTS